MAGASKQRQTERNGVPALEELNLVEFPLALLAKAPPKEQTEVVFEDAIWDQAAGEQVTRKVTIRSPAEYGLPTAFDQDVLLAAMVLTQEKNRFESETVEFTIYELLDKLKQAKGGWQYERFVLSLDRWGATWIKFDNAWRKKGRWTKEAFSILQHYRLASGRDFDPDEPQTFSWAKVVQESIRDSHTKPFDFEFYVDLELPTSKRLYRFLDKRFWTRGSYDSELSGFCVNKLGMAEYARPNRYKEKLWPAIEELMHKNFLTECGKEEVFEKIGPKVYRVNFRRRAKPKRQGSVSRGTPQAANRELEELLTTIGIEQGPGPTDAAALVAELDNKLLAANVERFKTLRENGKQATPGLVVSMTRQGKLIRLPDGAKTKQERAAERQREAERDAARRQNERQEREQAQAERDQAARAAAAVKAALEGKSEAEIAALFEAAYAAGPEEVKRYYDGCVKLKVSGGREEARVQLLHRHLFGDAAAGEPTNGRI